MENEKVIESDEATEAETDSEVGQEILEAQSDLEQTSTSMKADSEFAEDDEEAEESEYSVERVRLPVTARVSSLLFVATKPLTSEQLAEASSARVERVEEALEELQAIFKDDVHGFSLDLVGGAWQFRTAPAAANYIHRLIPKTARKLSRAAAETLAVIAYKQPVQRAEIEAIRGVDALPTLKTLLDAKLIRIVGREQTAGHPALYGTTKTFLEKFGLADLSELPSARELSQFLEEPGEVVQEELSFDPTSSESAEIDLLQEESLDAHEESRAEDTDSEDGELSSRQSLNEEISSADNLG